MKTIMDILYCCFLFPAVIIHRQHLGIFYTIYLTLTERERGNKNRGLWMYEYYCLFMIACNELTRSVLRSRPWPLLRVWLGLLEMVSYRVV